MSASPFAAPRLRCTPSSGVRAIRRPESPPAPEADGVALAVVAGRRRGGALELSLSVTFRLAQGRLTSFSCIERGVVFLVQELRSGAVASVRVGMFPELRMRFADGPNYQPAKAQRGPAKHTGWFSFDAEVTPLPPVGPVELCVTAYLHELCSPTAVVVVP